MPVNDLSIMKYFVMRMFYMLYCIEKNFFDAIMLLISPLFIKVMKWLASTSFLKKRLKKQGRSTEFVIKDIILLFNKSLYDLKDGWVIIYAEASLDCVFAAILVNVVMFTQLLTCTQYFTWCMDHYTVLSVLTFIALGHIIANRMFLHNYKFIPYFKKFEKDSKMIRFLWHLMSSIIIVIIILLFIFFTKLIKETGTV